VYQTRLKSHPSRVCGLKSNRCEDTEPLGNVAPFAGVWIEIAWTLSSCFPYPVAPFAGVWIEINRETWLGVSRCVAPFAGVWIEIHPGIRTRSTRPVAPFAGVWIEINLTYTTGE